MSLSLARPARLARITTGSLRRLRRRGQRIAWNVRWGGKSYSAYHRHVMDDRATRDPREAVGGLWDELGRFQVEFMNDQGLMPHHTLLDIGCGCLRGGLHFIRYLEPGNYWGTEVSPGILEAGKRFLADAGLEDQRPNLLIADGFDFDELAGRRFDYALAFGVFTDVPAESVRECFRNLHRALSPGGAFYATFGLHRTYVADPVRVEFRYPWSFFERLGEEFGLRVDLVEGTGHPKGHSMLKAALKST